MSTVEAAASLFGPEEPSDPFASLGVDNPLASPPIITPGSVYEHEASNADQPPDSGDPSDLFSAQDLPAAPSAYSKPDHPGHHNTSYSQEQSSTAQNYDGWYDEHGQWHVYGQPPSEAVFSGQGHVGVPDYSTSSDPYAPKAGHISAPYDVQHATRSQSPYDPYNPNVQVSSNNYGPPAAPALQHTYDPYKPMASNLQQPPVSQTLSYPYPSSHARPVSAIPTPPPAQVTAFNRPKITNAYDPPFPTSKPARRTVPRSIPPASGVYGQQSYPTHGSVPSIPPSRPDISSTGSVDQTVGSGERGPLKVTYLDPLQYGTHPRHSTDDNFGGLSDSHSGYARDEHSHSQNLRHVESHPTHTWPSSQTSFDGRNANEAPPLPPPPETFPPRQSTSANSEGPTMASGRFDDSFQSTGAIPANTFHDSSYSPYTGDNVYVDSHASQYPTFHSAGSQRVIPSGNETFQSSSHPGRDYTAQNDSSIPPSHSAPYGASKSLGDHYSTQSDERATSPYSLISHSRTHSDGSERGVIPQNASSSPNTLPRVQRTLSPDSIPQSLPNGARDLQTVQGKAYNQRPFGSRDQVSPPPVNQTHYNSLNSVPDPYAPIVNHPPSKPGPGRAASLAAPPSDSQSGVNTYSPPMGNGLGDNRNRSMSTSSVYSASGGVTYASSQHVRHQPSEPSDYGNFLSRYDYSSFHDAGPLKAPSMANDFSSGQELLISAVNQTPYAPSPSLLGSNDPLGRTSARVPIVSFGFGGKLVTCFHGSSVLNTGFDVALSSRRSMDVNIRVLNKIIPESTLDDTTATSFPGPLLADPGSPTVSLVRTGTAAKTKKPRVIKYLTERIEEVSQGIGYLQPGTADRRRLEGKLVLVRLLKVMVENDGNLSGTPQIDMAVRAALIPRLDMSSSTSASDTAKPTPTLDFSPADMHSSTPDLSFGLHSSASFETPVATSILRPSALDRIQEFLLRGDRQKAYHFALDEKLWAHAMVIASSIDKEAWKEVVNEFLKTELGVSRGSGQLNGTEVVKPNGRESLRVAYSMFSGQGAAAVQELLPQNLLSRMTGSMQVPPLSHNTPMSASFSSAILLQAPNIPADTLSKWTETAAMMLSNPMTVEASSALTALGDYLWSNQWVEAAHACYLLAPQTSPIGGVGIPTTRITLLGSLSPANCPSFHKDLDPIVLTEIVEFALSLASPAKGQEAFNGLPHLQAYRLIRANALAEVGQIQLASRYCEAIAGALHRSSPHFTATFIEQLKTLSDRIIGAPHIEKSGSWIGGKMSKPSLDKLGTWLEGRFTKLITGDQSPLPAEHAATSEDRTFDGPFSHYSTISSSTSSASTSPLLSAANLNVFPPPRRTGSAMAYPLAANPPVQMDRASSAMDHIRRKPSPAPRIASANAATTTFAQSPSFGSAINHHPPNGNSEATTARLPLATEEQQGVTHGMWWGSSYVADSSQTPTATSFLRADQPKITPSSSEFFSLMDDDVFPVITADINQPQPQPPTVREDEEVEDLGFGNPSKREKPPNDEKDEQPKAAPSTGKAEPAQKPPAERTETNNASSSGSWFSRFALWGKRETSGPIKASLGEETTFYYDKELKRWVNKAESAAPSKPADPPPPPSRAQTASPGKSSAVFPPGTGGNPGPPNRPASVNDLSTSQPTRSVVRPRSNLVPIESEPATVSPSGGPPPPPSRPRSQAAKRNIRSRYVDVLQQEGS